MARKNSETGNHGLPAPVSTFAAFSGALTARYEAVLIPDQGINPISLSLGSGEVNHASMSACGRLCRYPFRLTQALIIAGGWRRLLSKAAQSVRYQVRDKRAALARIMISWASVPLILVRPTDRRVSEEVLNFSGDPGPGRRWAGSATRQFGR